MKLGERLRKGRDLEIMHAVLGGATLQSVGRRYGIQRERVRRIIFRQCWLANEVLFKQMDRSLSRKRLKWLRKRKAHFLTPAAGATTNDNA